MSQVFCMFKNVNLIVYILVILFGIASWIDMNGLWVELPILVQRMPEGWDLPSYMVIIAQMANIGPLIFTIAKLKWAKNVKEVPIIYLIIGIGAISCLLLAFFWHETTIVAGVAHSTALLVLSFFLALVDCTSSVVFLPFMAHFKPEYITAFFVGEGCSSLLPGLVALGQGASQTVCVNETIHTNVTINGTVVNETSYAIVAKYQTPRFSIETFFYFLFGMLVTCGIAFTLLKYSWFARMEQQQPKDEIEDSNEETGQSAFYSSYELDGHEEPVVHPTRDHFLDAADNINSQTQLLSKKRRPEISIHKDSSVTVTQIKPSMTKSDFYLFMLIIAWANGLGNGILPSIQSYSVLPYGNIPYHLAVTLASIASPLSCFVAFVLPATSSRLITLLCLIGTGISGYCVALAALSPDPLLVDNVAGKIIVVAAWFSEAFLLTYTKVSIASLLRREGKRALLWCGALTQIGSAIGAVVMFLLVNVFKLFVQGSPCRQ